jgi:adenylate cyclase
MSDGDQPAPDIIAAPDRGARRIGRWPANGRALPRPDVSGPAKHGVVAVVVAVLCAFLLPAAWSLAATDTLTPAAGEVDDRVVVVAFDERTSVPNGLLSIADRRGVYLTNLAALADRAGAAAVVFVGFDSLALREGASDRSAVAGSEAVRRLGIAPLLDVSLESGGDGPPRAARYRVDELAGSFAGIGLPLAPEGSVVRAVPAVATAPTLEPGAAVQDSADPVRGLVYGLSVRGVLAALGDPSDAAVVPGGITVAGRTVPLEDGRLRVRWTAGLNGHRDDAVVSADALFASTATPDWSGKVVLVGTTDPSRTTYLDTPLGPLPELLVHANAVNTLLTREYLRPAPAWTDTLAVLAAAAAVAVAWRRRGWPWAAAIAVVAVVGWPLIGRVAAGQGLLLDPLRPAAAALVAVVVLVLGDVGQQMMQRRHLAALFSEYVPAAVARDLIGSGRAETAQAGERLLVSVLFCDLRDFTPTAARLSPPDVRRLLDCYYEALSPIVFRYDGTVLQYTGDEIFAVFGAPLPRSDHADAALACAREMQARQPELSVRLAAAGLPPVAFGIGMHTGLVVAAHVGSSIRRQYSIIGDPVNVGNRLCAQAGEGEIVFSQTLAEHLRVPTDAPADGPVRLRGVAEPVAVHRLAAQPAVALDRRGEEA